ncbi:phage holin family protein [Aeribacillus pallidus]|jgi:toxin secretion/phage lysis holin|nr:phage holin family protein [Aeribacillus pallidus]
MDHIFKTVVSIGGALASYLFGGWSALLGILLAFVAFDYISGIIASATEGKLSSKIGFKAIPKKVMIFVMVAMGNLVDQALGGDNHIFRDGVIFFYLANELLSIIENAGRAGLPIPEQIKNAVDILKGKGEGK